MVIIAIILHLDARGFGIGFMTSFVLELAPDLIELGFHHRRRYRKVMRFRQMVEQLAFHIGACEPVQLLLDLTFEQATELLEIFEAQCLGEIIVCNGSLGSLYLLDDKVERRLLTLQVGNVVIVWKRHVDLLFVAGFHADQLILEARNQAARADLDRHVVAFAAVERLSPGLAKIIHHDQVADHGLMRGLCVFEAFLLRNQRCDVLIDG